MSMPLWYAAANTAVLFACLLALGLTLQYLLKGIIKIAGFISSPKLVSITVNCLTFPGVAHHEIAHAVMACASGARVTEIKLFEFGTGHLGHVNYRTRGGPVRSSVQHCLTSMGPVLLGPVTIVLLWWMYYMNNWASAGWIRGLLAYLTISIALHMRLSKSDLRNIWHGLPLCLVAACACIWLFRIDVIGFIAGFAANSPV